jgi:hypothetical protein
VGSLAQHCTFIVMCPPNNTRSSATYKSTGLHDWRVQDCNYLGMVILSSFIKKTLFSNTKLSILNIDIVQVNYIKLLKDVKSLIF